MRKVLVWYTKTGCWEVQRRALSMGYPVIRIDRRTVRLSRVIYTHFKGPLLPGQVVRHTCDNKLCINPDHLLSGTIQDNNKDAYERGRICFGDKSPHTKIPEKAIEAIINDSRLHREIADDYGVSRSCISMIKSGRKRIYGKTHTTTN